MEIQEIINNKEQDEEQKTKQLKQLLSQHQQKRKKKKKKQQQNESILQMFKKYSTQKRRHKTKCSETIKTKEGQILPIEKGYSHYLSQTLMKPINELRLCYDKKYSFS